MTIRSHTIAIHTDIWDGFPALVQLAIDGEPFDIALEHYGPSHWHVLIFRRGEQWNESVSSFPDAHTALWDAIGGVCDTLAAERGEGGVMDDPDGTAMTQQAATRRKVLTLRFSAKEYVAIIAHLTELEDPGEKPPTREAVERWARSIVLEWVASVGQETGTD